MAIVDRFGNPIQSKQLKEEQSSRMAALSHSIAGHPSRGLTAAKLARILDAAEQGDITAQHELFVDMEEKDAHIFAEMSKRKRSILTLPWSVEPPNNPTPAEEAFAAEVEDWLKAIPDFEDVLIDALDAIGHGFACLEIKWAQQLGEWLPESITHRPQTWFQLAPDRNEQLRLRDGSHEGAQLWQFGWMTHVHRAKSGMLARGGLHRVLSWPYLFKNYSVRDLAEFLEIYGLPMRLGKYASGATKEEKATLLSAVIGIGHDAAGIIPHGMEIEFMEAAKGSHDPFEFMMSWAERCESKVILGGTLTSQADGKSSTNALGNVHNEVRHDLMISDARQLTSTVQRDLIYPLAALNHGTVDPRRLPRMVFDTREPADLSLYADSLPKLVGIGLQIPEDWAHEKLQIPKPAEGEKVLTAAATPDKRSAPKAALRLAALNFRTPTTQWADYPDQAAERLGANAQEHIESWLTTIGYLVDNAPDFETLQQQLAEVFSDLPVEELAAVMELAFTAAELAGRTAVLDGHRGA